MGEFIKVAKDLEVKEISKGVKIPNLKDFVTNGTITHVDVKESDDGDDEPEQTPENLIRPRQPRKSNDCSECGKVFTTNRDMLMHYRWWYHLSLYSCDSQSTLQKNLPKHIQNQNLREVIK